MKNYYKYFSLIGFLVGFVYGLGVLAYAFYRAPGIPGFYETLLQLLILIVLGLLFAFYGTILWLFCIGTEKLYIKFFKST